MKTKLTGRFWLCITIFSLMGQIAWVVENMYFNVFIYKMFHASAADISNMVAASAVTATVTTVFMGALSDKIGKRKLFICGGYLLWGISIFSFILLREDIISKTFGMAVNAATVGISLTIILDCVMTFFGSTANDAAFNAWLTDSTDSTNRGAAEGINAMMPLVSILVVFGGFMFFDLEAASSWTLIFTIIGILTAAVGNNMSAAAALFGAGVGTIVYQLFTKFRSPVFLGSSFAFIGPMLAAFAGGVSMSLGYAGLIIGAVFAGLVYVIIAVAVKFAGVKWIDKVMPAAVIGPTVALIGLSLAGAAINDVFSYGAKTTFGVSSYFIMETNIWVSMICALVTLFVVILVSTYGKKMIKLIPFIIGILAGYAVAALFTVIGEATGNNALKVIDFSVFSNMNVFAVPEFTFLEALKGVHEINGGYVATIAAAYVPVAFVVFAEHLADHKNLSSIIGQDLLTEPGLHRTLLGDGVGSMFGAFFGGCPNTTYGESVGCVAITRNASVITITTAAIMCIIISFFGPFVAFLDSIPGCVMGGVCITLYGFIAVSGLKMVQKVDLNQNRNLFTVAAILIPGIGGMALAINGIYITNIACALILGIITNVALSKAKED